MVSLKLFLQFLSFTFQFPDRAFSVVETLESAWAIITNHTSPAALSTQQLISCLYGRTNVNGCKGAVLDDAFAAVQVSYMIY